MARFTQTPAALNDYITLLADGARDAQGNMIFREGNVAYFYRDSEDLVTIGIGHLVDRRGEPLPIRQQSAHQFAQRYRLYFQGQPSVQQIVADWNAARTFVARRRASQMVNIRLVAGRSRDICADDIETKENILRHLWGHWTDQLDSSIQMALIDHLFNPSRARIGNAQQFGGRMGQFKNSLNPTHAQFNPTRAAVLYREIGDHLSQRASYQRRVNWRIERILEGAERMATGFKVVVSFRTRAIRAKTYTSTRSGVRGVIGVFRNSASADDEAVERDSWSKPDGSYECWVHAPSQCKQRSAEVVNGKIFAVFENKSTARDEVGAKYARAGATFEPELVFN